MMTDPLSFAIAVVALLATPGPTNALLLTAATMSGSRAFRLIAAEIAGYLIAVLTIALLIGPLVADWWALGMVLRSAAALYLLMVAVRLWRRGGSEFGSPRLIEMRHVFTTTLLNPKAILFGLGIVPVQAPDPLPYLVAFAALIALVGSGWIAIGLAIRRGLLPPEGAPLVPRIGATIIAGFAGYLVLAPLMA